MKKYNNRIMHSIISLYISLVSIIFMLCKIRVDKIKIRFILVFALGLLFIVFRKRISNVLKEIKYKTIYKIVGIIACLYFGSYCYNTLLNSEFIINLLNKFSLPIEPTLLLLVVVGSLFCFPAATLIVQYVLDSVYNINDLFSEYRCTFKYIAIVSIVYIVGIYPIIRANYIYKDDMIRASTGTGFGVWDRYLSVFLSAFIHGDISYLTDVSPLTQLIAIAIMSLSAILLACIITNKKEISLCTFMSLAIFGLSPYLLECYSYKYDSPYMMLSIFLAIFPFAFIQKSKKAFLLSSFISALLICISYQTSMCIYPTILIVLCVLRWNRNEWSIKRVFNNIVDSIISYCGGLLFFYFLIMEHNKSFDYASTTIFSIDKLLNGILNNIATYLYYVVTDFKMIWLIIIAIIIAIFIFLQTYKTKQNKILSFFVNVLALMLCLSLSFSLYPMLEKPIFLPRAMYGFTIFVSIISIVCVDMFDNAIAKSMSIALGWMFISFCATYGNALFAQAEYTTYRIEMVINELNDIEYMNDDIPSTIQIKGTTGYAPIIENMSQDYQIVKRLVNCSFSDESAWWGACGLYNYYDLRNVVFDYNTIVDETILDTIKETMFFDIKGNENYILINLK